CQRVDEIVEVLYFGNRPEAAHRKADTLANDRGFAYPRVRYAQFPVLLLESCEALVYITDLSDIFSKSNNQRVTLQRGIEALLQHFPSVDNSGVFRVHRRDGLHI